MVAAHGLALALACASCFRGNGSSPGAWYAATALLLVLPPLMVLLLVKVASRGAGRP